jgi:hypothetical protein
MKKLLWFHQLTLAVLVFLWGSGAAFAEKRIAFIVGNSAYEQGGSLANPVNDATAMSKKLKQLGFITVDGFDLNYDDFNTRIRDFAKLSSDADLAVFFYAGHGIAVNGENYLIPIDAKFEDATALDFEAISVKFIASLMRRSGGVNLLFLDACRNNPLAGTLTRSLGQSARSTVSSGLAEMKLDNPGRGLAIAFSTSPGEVALDGVGAHSPFTSALLNHIDAKNTDITEVMGRVTGQVYEETGKAQRPWLNTSLTGSVILNPVAIPTSGVTTTQTAVDKPQVNAASNSLEIEKTVYDMARDSGRKSDFQAYLDTFPNGIFAAFAKNEILELEQKEVDQKLSAVDTDAPTDGNIQVRTANSGAWGVMPSPEILSLPSNSATEDAMGMNRTMRREIQARLNLTGNDVGKPDGSFGQNTRRGILSWQTQLGFIQSGFLNQKQYQFLSTQTQNSYISWAASNPVPKRKKRKTSKKPAKSKQNTNGIGAFLGGLAAGVILSK